MNAGDIQEYRVLESPFAPVFGKKKQYFLQRNNM